MPKKQSRKKASSLKNFVYLGPINDKENLAWDQACEELEKSLLYLDELNICIAKLNHLISEHLK